MKTPHSPTAQAFRVLLAAGASLFISSCSMPPRQAWNMIQHDGLFNYWAYASGHEPTYSRPSPPLQSSGSGILLSNRPSHMRYMESWNSPAAPGSAYPAPYRAPASNLSSTTSKPSPFATNRYYAPSTSPAPAPQLAMPTRRPKSPSSQSTRRSKPSTIASRNEEPRVRIPVEPPPSKVSSGSSNSSSSNKTASAPKKELPFGTAVAGRPNMVNSPYAQKSQLVDVAGMSPGQLVKCPYSGKLFKVPPTLQASNKAESKLESPTLKSPAKSEAKSEDKPKTDAAPKSEPKPEAASSDKKS